MQDSYDVIVVGSGMGAVTAAPLLARAGLSVLVVERAQAPGGYAHAFRRGPYVFDPAVHSIVDPSLFDGLLEHLGVRDQCTLLPTDRLYKAALPDMAIDLPLTTSEEFVGIHANAFPRHAHEIRAFFELCERIHREAHTLPAKVSLRDLDAVSQRLPLVFRYRKSTLAEVLDEHFSDERVKLACSAMGLLLGLPPSRLSFQTFTQMLYGYIGNGAFYVQGGAEELVHALVTALERAGGELLLGTGVERVLVEDRRAVGVELEGGERIRAGAVISNADALQTFHRLVGAEHLPARFLRGLARLQPSVSGFSVYAATRADLCAAGTSHMVFSWPSWDSDAAYAASFGGRPGSMIAYVPTMVDSTLAPPGEHIVCSIAFAPYDLGAPWAEEKGRYEEMLLAETDRLLPGFRDGLTFADSGTPLTLERFSLNHRGAIYGWENTPEHTASKRPSHATPIDGLYLAGQWTQPGAGFLRATVSGVHTAQLVMQGLGCADGARFAHPNLPPLH